MATVFRGPLFTPRWPHPREWMAAVLSVSTVVGVNNPLLHAPVQTVSAATEVSGPLFPIDQTAVNATAWNRSTPQVILSSIVPYNQDDWPNPRGYTRNEQLGYTSSGCSLTNVLVPFSQDDWPNPRGPKTNPQDWQQASDVWLIGQDQFPNGAGGANQFDWPVPKGPASVITRWTWTDSFKLPLQAGVSVPFAQDDWPNPNLGAARSIELRTWLQTGYLEEVGEPFAQDDWPNPIPIRYSVGYGTWLDSFKLPLTTVAPPFIQQDWPVPKGAKSVDGISSPGLSLLTAIPPPPATVTFDWPNPRGPARLIDFGFSWFNQQTQPAPIKPTLQSDWPVPKGPRPISDQFAWSDSFKLPLQWGPSVPFAQDDWPVPKGPASVIDRWIFDQSFPLTQAVFTSGQFITTNEDWRLPRSLYYKPNQDLGFTFENQLLTLAPVIVIGQSDWPNPQRPRYPNPTFSDSFKLPLQAGTAVPFAQEDWPNPRGYQRAVDLLTWTQEGYDEEFSPPPIRQSDWPNPRGPRPLVVDWTTTPDLPLNAAAAAATLPINAFNQFDWPVPKGKQPPGLLWTDSFKLTLQGPPNVPFSQEDWPLPRGMARSVELLVQRPFNLPVSFTTYTHQFDWPVPRGPKGSISLYTWTDSFKLPLQTIRPKNQYDWPNPRGYSRLVEYPVIGTDQTLMRTPIFGTQELLLKRIVWLNPPGPARLQVAFTDTNFLNLSTGFIPTPPPPPVIIPNKAMTARVTARAGAARTRPGGGSGRTRPGAGSGKIKPGHDP